MRWIFRGAGADQQALQRPEKPLLGRVAVVTPRVYVRTAFHQRVEGDGVIGRAMTRGRSELGDGAQATRLGRCCAGRKEGGAGQIRLEVAAVHDQAGTESRVGGASRGMRAHEGRIARIGLPRSLGEGAADTNGLGSGVRVQHRSDVALVRVQHRRERIEVGDTSAIGDVLERRAAAIGPGPAQLRLEEPGRRAVRVRAEQPVSHRHDVRVHREEHDEAHRSEHPRPRLLVQGLELQDVKRRIDGRFLVGELQVGRWLEQPQRPVRFECFQTAVPGELPGRRMDPARRGGTPCRECPLDRSRDAAGEEIHHGGIESRMAGAHRPRVEGSLEVVRRPGVRMRRGDEQTRRRNDSADPLCDPTMEDPADRMKVATHHRDAILRAGFQDERAAIEPRPVAVGHERIRTEPECRRPRRRRDVSARRACLQEAAQPPARIRERLGGARHPVQCACRQGGASGDCGGGQASHGRSEELTCTRSSNRVENSASTDRPGGASALTPASSTTIGMVSTRPAGSHGSGCAPNRSSAAMLAPPKGPSPLPVSGALRSTPPRAPISHAMRPVDFGRVVNP